MTHGRTYAYTGDCFPQLHTLLHILQYVYEGGREDLTAVDAAEAEARKREGGSYMSADLSAVLTVLAQSAASVALAKTVASAKVEALT